MTGSAGRWRWVRWLWLAVGGVWGLWVGFGGYFGVSGNADSFASLFASLFFIGLALLGLFAGMAVGGATGWLVEHLLRRWGAGPTTALVVATLASLCAVWQVSSMVLGRNPGLRAPVAKTAAGAKTSPRNSCTSPAPSDVTARKSWDAECR